MTVRMFGEDIELAVADVIGGAIGFALLIVLVVLMLGAA
jgi:hypothetical protein